MEIDVCTTKSGRCVRYRAYWASREFTDLFFQWGEEFRDTDSVDVSEAIEAIVVSAGIGIHDYQFLQVLPASDPRLALVAYMVVVQQGPQGIIATRTKEGHSVPAMVVSEFLASVDAA